MEQTKRYSRLLLLGAAHSFNHSLFVVAPPLLTPFILPALGVSKAEIGLVSGTASFIYGAGALAGGPLGDRIGEAKTITLSLALSGFSTLLMLIAGVTRSIYFYGLALVVMAICASLYHPTANSLISKTFKGRVSESMGWHGMGGTLGVVLTPIVAFFIGANFGWPWAFVFFGMICIALAVLFVKSFGEQSERNFEGGSILDALRIRELWILLIFNVAIGFFMKGIELFFPTYLIDNRMISGEGAALAYTLLLAAGVPAQLIGGKAADKVGSKRVLIFTSTGICLALLSLLLIPVYMIGIALFIVLYGVAFYAHQPALNGLTGFLSPHNQRGAVYGIFFFTSFGIGSISQFLSGLIGDAYGLDAAFWFLTACAFAALALSFKLPEKRETK